MVPMIATFVVSLAAVLGVYWLFIVRLEDNAARQLQRRLKPQVTTRARDSVLTRKAHPLSALQGLDKLLGSSGRMLDPLRRVVEESGLPLTVDAVIFIAIATASFGFLIGRVATSMTWVAIILAIGGAAIPFLAVRFAQQRRIHIFEDQFPQAIELIAGALRAGHAFTTGVSMVADEIEAPLGNEFKLLYDHQNFGMPLPDALKAFSKRVPLLDARFFITAVLTQREAGGNLAEVLDNLSTVIRERSRVKRQVRVASAHGRITGWILSLMPPILAMAMTIVAPDHMRTFISDPLGVRMIILAIFLQVVGTVAIRRIVNVEF